MARRVFMIGTPSDRKDNRIQNAIPRQCPQEGCPSHPRGAGCGLKEPIGADDPRVQHLLDELLDSKLTPDECARSCRRQLGLASNRGYAISGPISVAA